MQAKTGLLEVRDGRVTYAARLGSRGDPLGDSLFLLSLFAMVVV